MTTLLVASTGGHLAELTLLRRYLVPVNDHVVWVTFDRPQARSLLAGQQVEFLPYIGPRQLGRVAAGALAARRLFATYDVEQVYSTGSAIALSVLPLAVRRGIPSAYIEAAARTSGPSTTGALLARLKAVKTYTQWPQWAGDQWRLAPSVFENYRPTAPVAAVPGPLKVVVSVGTIEGYGFRRLIERLIEILPPGSDVVWQTGSTDVSGLPIAASAVLPPQVLRAAMARADVVVTHAGVGSALSVLALGRRPVLVPRSAERGEHVDDHQFQIAGELGDRQLSVSIDADLLTYDDLLRAAALRVSPTPERRTNGGRDRYKPRAVRHLTDATAATDHELRWIS